MKQKFAKLTAWIFVLILVLTMGSTAVYAAGASAGVSGGSAEVGETITVTVTFKCDDIGVAGGKLSYDADVLEFKSGSGAAGDDGSVNLAVYADGSGQTSLTASMEFLAIKAGSSKLNLSEASVIEFTSEARYSVSGSGFVTVKDEKIPAKEGVDRIFGSNRYETAFKAADELKALRGGKPFDNVIVACGTNFADALAGSYLAAVKDAPILLVQPNMVNQVTSYIKSNLKAGGTVYILGGPNAVPANMESGLGGFNVKRFAGSNRYDTNLLILQEAGVEGKDILVATGTNFADSLSASATGKPILLVGTKLTSAQKQFLAGTTGTKYILGGTTAVSVDVENELGAYGAVKRLGGANRYATSVLIAETFFASPEAAVLSYAQNFPDGLCGGVIAYKQGAPMLLVTDSGAKAADTYAAKCGIKAGYVLGGTGLITDATAAMIFS